MSADRPSLESVPLWGELDEAGIDTMVAFLEAEIGHINALFAGKTSPADIQVVVAEYNKGKTQPNDDPTGGITELHAHRTPEGVLVALTMDRRGNTFLEYNKDRQAPIRTGSFGETDMGEMLARDPHDWIADQGISN